MAPAEAPRSQDLLTIRLGRRGAARWRSGHPWVFRDDTGTCAAPNGEIVTVLAPNGEPLGSAFYGSVSKIALRRIAGPGVTVHAGFFGSRLDSAIAYRDLVSDGAGAMRLVSSDADGIPGLIVDRYGPHLVVQSLTAGVERLLEELMDHLVRRLAPASVLARNDVNVRALEGLPLEIRVLHGAPPERVEVLGGGVRSIVDLREGQKTGAFLDQRENRLASARYLTGRVLDAFCYDGGFALAASRGCDSIVAVDSSAPALARATEAAVLNGFTNITFVKANVFDFLHEADQSGKKFEGVVLDPPAFVKSRKDLAAGLRAYKEINLRAMKCLSPGGVLVSCSCSYNLREDGFTEVLAEAAADARRRAIIMEKRSQARDHPILLGLPESHYLKCLILKVD